MQVQGTNLQKLLNSTCESPPSDPSYRSLDGSRCRRTVARQAAEESSKPCGVYYVSSVALALPRPSRRLLFSGVPLLGSKSGSYCESRRNPRSPSPRSSFEASGRWRGAVIVLLFDSAAQALQEHVVPGLPSHHSSDVGRPHSSLRVPYPHLMFFCFFLLLY